MRHLHLDPVSGLAGDMLLGALVDLGVPVETLAGLASVVPGAALDVVRGRRGGLAGTRVRVLVDGEDAGGAWVSEHRPSGSHAHEGRGHGAESHAHEPHGTHLSSLLDAIGASALPEPVKEGARSVFESLAAAEAEIHGTTLDDVHLHEVGAADALADVCGVLLAVHHLGVSSVSCGPIPLGSGTVRCAHGTLPVPAPVVAVLARDLPTVPGAGAHPTGELTTPTGLALARHLADSFGPPPPLRLSATGHGLGHRERPDVPNVVRLLLGERSGAARPEAQTVQVVTTVLDDLDGRLLPTVTQRLLDVGALDVTATTALGKKGRPALRLEVVVPDDAVREAIVGVLFAETPTLGVRWRREERATLPREHVTVETPWGAVRVKEGTWDGRVVTRQPEYEDCAARAEEHGVPVRAVLDAAKAASSG